MCGSAWKSTGELGARLRGASEFDFHRPVRVARRYDETSVTAFAARGALGATYVVMSNLYAHGIAQPYVRDAFVRLASAAVHKSISRLGS